MSRPDRMFPALKRAVVAGAALLVAAGLGTGPALASSEAGFAQISSPRLHDGIFSGVLTVGSGQSAVEVDPASLKALVGNREYRVAVNSVASGRRATMLVVDTSGSMGEAGMATVRSAVAAFLKAVPADVAVGLVSFAGTAGVDLLPTTDRVRVQKAVDALRSGGETTLYDGVTAAAGAMGAYTERSILLLSDGGDTQSKASQASATAALKKTAVRADVIGFKTEDSDNTVLKGFAEAGKGTVVAAGNDAAVRQAFTAVAKVLESQVTFSFTPDQELRNESTVTIVGKAGGSDFSAQTAFNFGTAPVPTTTTAATEKATVAADDEPVRASVEPITEIAGFPTMLLVGLGATFLGIIGLGVALAAPLFRSNRRQRIEGIEHYVSGAPASPMQQASVTPSSLSTGLVNLGDKVMEGRESTSKTMSLIERADLPLRPGEWWVLRIVSVVVGIAVALVLFRGGLGMTLFAIVAGALMGYVLPAAVLRFLARRRCKKFEAQLPDVLTLVASSLSTGFSLLQALDAVSKDAAQPAAKEFSRALAETRIGADISDSLEHMAQRMESVNMKWAAMAIQIQRQVGGNLAETLRTTAKTLRERESLQRHVKALSAEGKLSAYILIALPIGIFFYTMQTNREYVELLWTRPLGLLMLGGGIVSLAIGIFWMRKVVEVEV